MIELTYKKIFQEFGATSFLFFERENIHKSIALVNHLKAVKLIRNKTVSWVWH